jgi:hypothetical protein
MSLGEPIPGRNDPCHCGSGKKYKKCCLAKDEEARQTAKAELATSAGFESTKEDKTSRKETDPHIEAFNARLSDFEAADYEGKFDIFIRTLDDPKLMDGEMAFEMLHDLFRYTIEHGERNRFDTLVRSLRERLPETYAAEACFFLSWLISNALVEGRSSDAASLFLELASLAGKDIDIFNRAEEMMAYHGQIAVLVDSMRLAWPEVKSSGDVVPWGIDEFCNRAISYELLHFADHTPDPTVQSGRLLERLEFYSEIDPKQVFAYLAHLTNNCVKPWTMDDFVLSTPRRSRDEEDEEDEMEAITTNGDQPNSELNLYHLTIEFLGYLRRVEGVPYTKGELGRRELHRFILDRHDGKLEYRESMLQSAQRDIDRRKGRRLPPKRKYRRYQNMLVPDRDRLDHFLAGLLDMMNQLYHRASALFEIIPAWLRFIEMHGPIDAEARMQTLGDLIPLAERLGRIFSQYTDDPGPYQAIDGWSKTAEL